ncbi:MAG: AhpC/TSA family protein [Prevotella sp.]|nr:AhpC/TSA family protein [Prevotella sp.]
MRQTISKLHTYATIAIVILIFCSCGKEKFHVDGNITNAKDSTLYFEHNGLDGISVIDSTKLDESGHFQFKGEISNNPEFYRLRIAGQIINIAIDSTETIKLKASYPMMATNYTIEGSYENQKVKELALQQIELQAQCQAVANNPQLGTDSTNATIRKIVEQYKDHVKRNYIYKEPKRAYSYFALFQYIIVNNTARLLFNPRENPEDVKVFGAVATSWDTYYPGSERGENLHNIALEGMKDQRIIRSQQEGMQLDIDPSKVSEAGVIDLPLMDNKGHIRHLTELKGKVVLLDFHMFASEGSTQYIMALRELYNKYHAQGFEIYQVSLDENEHFWKTQTAALPWINVHDDGTASQAYLAPVATAPIIYLIDRENNIVKNPAQIKDISAEIQSLL